MRYGSFEGFGVEYYKNGEVVGTSYFNTLDLALRFYKDMSWSYDCKIITVNEWGIKIDELM